MVIVNQILFAHKSVSVSAALHRREKRQDRLIPISTGTRESLEKFNSIKKPTDLQDDPRRQVAVRRLSQSGSKE